MRLNGKITSINPGTVIPSSDGKFTFTLVVNGDENVRCEESFVSANAAKQVMRETVYLMRKKHSC